MLWNASEVHSGCVLRFVDMMWTSSASGDKTVSYGGEAAYRWPPGVLPSRCSILVSFTWRSSLYLLMNGPPDDTLVTGVLVAAPREFITADTIFPGEAIRGVKETKGGLQRRLCV